MKLQQLQLDLEVISFADVARLVLRLRNVDRVLKALKVQQRKPQSGFGQQHGDELLAHVESESAFGVRNLGAGYGCLVDGSLQAALPFVAALEQVPNSDVELLDLI